MEQKEENFEIVSGVDDVMVVTTNDHSDEYQSKIEQAVKDYFANNPRYSSVFEGDNAITTVTLAELDSLAENPQNSIEKTRKIAKIVDKYINKNYLVGMVDTIIRSNLNTSYKVSYPIRKW